MQTSMWARRKPVSSSANVYRIEWKFNSGVYSKRLVVMKTSPAIYGTMLVIPISVVIIMAVLSMLCPINWLWLRDFNGNSPFLREITFATHFLKLLQTILRDWSDFWVKCLIAPKERRWFPNEFENHANLLLFFCVVTIYMLICFIRAIITSFAKSMNNKRLSRSKGATNSSRLGQGWCMCWVSMEINLYWNWNSRYDKVWHCQHIPSLDTIQNPLLREM